MKIGVIGLGYVGLPLFCRLSEYFEVFGIDVSKSKIHNLKLIKDLTGELNSKELSLLEKNKSNISYNYELISNCDVYIITVPTPIDSDKRPNLSALKDCVASISKFIKKENLIILESTVYPGATKKYISLFIEKNNNLKLNEDFGVGYSPERINPGDKDHKLTNTIKIISASSTKYLNIVEDIYSKIVNAGLFKTSSIEVAEATKIMENVQRDINIAFMNEFEEILKPMNIDIWEVLEAAKTKWNFLDFKPGFVGGHCIGVDPYYLIHQSENNGITPNLIRNAREINERKVKTKTLSLIKKLSPAKNKKILLLGITFKPNCSDVRNSKIFEMIEILEDFELETYIFDPYISPEMFPDYKFLRSINDIDDSFELICLTVEHQYFFSTKFKSFMTENLLNKKIIYLKNL